MGIMARAKDGDKEYKLVPAGAHTALCNLVADVGLQQTGYGPKHKVYLRFEIPGQRIEWEKDGQKHEGPMSVGQFFTVSLSQKSTLRGFLESWRGRAFTKDELDGFDLFNVAGAPCIVNIVHNTAAGKTYANIKAIMPLPSGTAKPKPENPILKYSPDAPGDKDKLPDWLKEKINKAVSVTPEDERAPETAGVDPDDDIPF